MTSDSPAVARRRLRLALRAAREAAGLTQGQVAEELGSSISKVNRMEVGEVTVSRADLLVLIHLYGLSDQKQILRMLTDAKTARQRGWWDAPPFKDHLTAAIRELIQFEGEATSIRTFQTTIFPGALQTWAYAKAILDGWHLNLSADEREVRLRARLRRQSDIFGRDEPPRYKLLVDESVLLRQIGGPVVTGEQMLSICVRISSGLLSARILPMAAATMVASLGSFVVLGVADEHQTVVYFERYAEDSITQSHDTVMQYSEIFDKVWDLALDEETSRAMFEEQGKALISVG